MDGTGTDDGVVVLLDEIDKADPDVPNDLLVPVGSLQFVVTETATPTPVQAKHPLLLVITTNDERQLPQAFLRRCVVLELERAGVPRLVAMATAHFGPVPSDFYRDVAERVVEFTRKAEGKQDALPSAAEYLDTVRAFRDLEVDPKAKTGAWRAVMDVTMAKPADRLEAVR